MSAKGVKTKFLRRWEDAPNYMGPDLSDHFIVFVRTRDSDLLTDSNFEYLKKQLKDLDGVQVLTFNHWGIGWIEAIMIHEDAKESLEKAEQFLTKYHNYPVFDEEDYYQREYDATVSNIASEGGVDTDTAKRVYEWLSQHNPDSLEAVDGGGGYPDKSVIDTALREATP